MTYPPRRPGPYGPTGSYGPGGSAPDPYGPPPGYRPPYSYVGPPPPPRRRTGLVVGIVIAVLVLIGAGAGAYYLFFRASDTQTGANATPQQVASGFAHAYTSLAHTLSADDLARVDGYLCAKDQGAMRVIYDHQKNTNSTDRSFSMRASQVSVQGVTGTFQIVVTASGGASEPRRGKLVRQDQRWLVCDTV